MKDAALVVLVALGLLLAGRSCAQESAYADAIEAKADSIAALVASVDSMAAAREAREAVYLADLVATEDSAQVWRARAEALQAEADSFRLRADAVATDLVATLTTEQQGLFIGYRAYRDSIDATLIAEREDARAERDQWRARHDDVAALYDGLKVEAGHLRAVIIEHEEKDRIQEAALRAAGRRNWITTAVAVVEGAALLTVAVTK